MNVPLWEYKIPLGLCFVSLSCIVLSLLILFQSSQPQTPIQFSDGSASPSSALKRRTIVVDIEGAVNHPGVYTLEEGARVEEVLTAAGGVASDADVKQIERSINRAQKAIDGGKIFIPFLQTDSSGAKESEYNMSHNILGSETGSLININTAPEEDLESLPGVGPSTAKKIIAGRPYMTLEELVSKKAVGQKLYDKIKANLAL
jgi:competence protein ComEA